MSNNRYHAICLSIEDLQDALTRETILNLQKILRRNVQVVLYAGNASKEDAIKYVTEKIIDVIKNNIEAFGLTEQQILNSLKNISIMYNGGKDITYSESDYFDVDEPSYDFANPQNNVIRYLQMPKENIYNFDRDAKLYSGSWPKIEECIVAICLKNPNAQTTKHNLARAIQERKQQSILIMQEANERISRAFGSINGCEGVFHECGAVRFEDDEWELLKDSPLKRLFMQKNDLGYMYSLPTNTSHILRGANNYYYFMAHVEKSKKISYEDALSWYKENTGFLQNSRDAISSGVDPSNDNKKLLLGIMDNVRNLSLILMNSAVLKKYKDQTIYVSLESFSRDTDIARCHDVCKKVYEVMDALCSERPLNEQLVADIDGLLEEVQELNQRVVERTLSTNDEAFYYKSFRTKRETDSYIENRIAMEQAIKQLIEQNPNMSIRDIYCSGVCYGGIELPFLAESILKNTDIHALPSIITIAGNYESRHSEGNTADKEPLIQEGIEEDEHTRTLVGDDLLTTGGTMQIVQNILHDNGINVDNLMFVRYPSLNRVPQMLLPGRGSVNTRLFDKYVLGIPFPNVYSKISDGTRDENRQLIFDRVEAQILGYLGENEKNFSPGSRVAIYMEKFLNISKDAR